MVGPPEPAMVTESRSAKDLAKQRFQHQRQLGGSYSERGSLRSSASAKNAANRQPISARGSITSSLLRSLPEGPQFPLRPGEVGAKPEANSAAAAQRADPDGFTFVPIPRQWNSANAPGAPSSSASVWNVAKGDNRTFGCGKTIAPYRTGEGQDWDNWPGKVTQQDPRAKEGVFRADMPCVYAQRQRNKKVLNNHPACKSTIADAIDHTKASLGRPLKTVFIYDKDGSAGMPVCIEKNRNMKQVGHHPAKHSVVDTVVFNHELDSSGANHVGSELLENGAAGTSEFFERARGKKMATNNPNTKSMVDTAIWGRDMDFSGVEYDVSGFDGLAGREAWTERARCIRRIEGAPAETCVVGAIVYDNKKDRSERGTDHVHMPTAPFTDLMEGAGGKHMWDHVCGPMKHFYEVPATRSRFGKVVYGREFGSEGCREERKIQSVKAGTSTASDAASSTYKYEEKPRGRKNVNHAIGAKTEFGAAAFGQAHTDSYLHLNFVPENHDHDDRNYAGKCSHHQGRKHQHSAGMMRTHHDDRAAHVHHSHGHHRHHGTSGAHRHTKTKLK